MTIKSKFLIKEAEKRWYSIEIIDDENSLFYISSKEKTVLFKDCDWGINTSIGYRLANNKYETYQILKRNWIETPATFILDDKSEYSNFDKLKYPFIVKPFNRWWWKWVALIF
jgi:hypothetical protein